MVKKGFKKIIIVIVVLAVISAILYFSIFKKEEVEYITAEVERGKLLQIVSETGTVKSASEIDLNFINSGKIAKILVSTGDNVKKDQVLAELDYSGLSIKEREAQANLDKLIRGAATTEIAVGQAGVNQTSAAYSAALNELEKVKSTAAENIFQAGKTLSDLESDSSNDITTYEQAVEVVKTSLYNAKKTYQQTIDNEEDDILTIIESELIDINEALDTIDSIISDVDSEYGFSVKDTSYINNTENSYEEAVALLSSADSGLITAKAGKTESTIDAVVNAAKKAINKTIESLNYCFGALENSITSSQYTQSELTADKASINTDLTTVLTSISNVQTAEQDLDDARLAYDTNISDKEEALLKAQVDLDSAIIDARNALNSAQISGDQQTTIAQAKVDNTKEAWQVAKAQLAEIKAYARGEDIILSQAALDSVRSQINDSIIKAPIDGTITKINYEIGEQTTQNEATISMLVQNNYEIEVDISEADIAKVNLNNPVTITLDAFGDDVEFNGKVYFIEPAETVIQDVIYYKVKIEFDINSNEYKKNIANIKSGMTANVIITTNKKDNVLLVPSRAVIQKNGEGKHVRVLVNGVIEEMAVVTGLRGDEGMVELLSGVNEGDDVVTLIKNKK